jgi:hypothetical protein
LGQAKPMKRKRNSIEVSKDQATKREKKILREEQWEETKNDSI